MNPNKPSCKCTPGVMCAVCVAFISEGPLPPEALIDRLARRLHNAIQRTEPGQRHTEAKDVWLYTIDLDSVHVAVTMNAQNSITRGSKMSLTSVRELAFPIPADDHEDDCAKGLGGHCDCGYEGL